jgi:hypothetical protein
MPGGDVAGSMEGYLDFRPTHLGPMASLNGVLIVAVEGVFAIQQ